MSIRTHVAVGAGCLVLGLVAGRWATPAKVVTVDAAKVKDDSRQQAATHDEAKVDTRAAQTAGPVVIKWKRWPVPVPAGCPKVFAEESETTKGATAATLDTHAGSKDDTAAKSDAFHQGDTFHSTVVTEQPKWLVGVQAGVDPRNISAGKLLYGASFEKKLFSSFYVGLWADSRLTGGVGARCAF